MSEWRMTYNDAVKAIGGDPYLSAAEMATYVNMAVRLGIVVPAQDGEERLRALIERVLHAEAPDEPASFSCGCSERSDGLIVVGDEYADKYGDGVCPRHGNARDLHMTKCGVCGSWHISREERAALEARPREE